ncbi:MAG: 23S rRNA (adenine(2503)-C(2))-methyltransferase RlmN [Candidatus Muirbacterium halophilum]|nr:23S rRNA (adenine(2503)-C(2))-methyltransferase RlmN [Candidatus Muirbacterium halophilum]MCK9474748.1 23S rRNA (adenine(2503)-C(2))-methyltransferase RlmN [Candidatus Muirbacterium halophilum]
MKKQSILDMSYEDLTELLISEGFKKFNSKQIFAWIYKKNTYDFNDMTDLSKQLRSYLIENFVILTSEIKILKKSEDGTIKFLLEYDDNEKIETVIIFHNDRTTLCVSSQIGCPLNCSFCVTGSTGYKRNLRAGEIIEQILHSNILGYFPTNIVFMGMGEPLLNLDNLTNSLKTIFSKDGLEYSLRKVTVSTSGLCDEMLELEKKFDYISWAISLHAPNNEIRNQIMPINKKYPLEKLVDVLKKLKLKYGRKLTIEYILIEDVNCEKRHALKLIELLKSVKYKINLIVYNENPYKDYKKPDMDKILEFQNTLIKAGIVCKIRKSKGEDISAACGQLACEK